LRGRAVSLYLNSRDTLHTLAPFTRSPLQIDHAAAQNAGGK
jgi:hypothetical protein